MNQSLLAKIKAFFDNVALGIGYLMVGGLTLLQRAMWATVGAVIVVLLLHFIFNVKLENAGSAYYIYAVYYVLGKVYQFDFDFFMSTAGLPRNTHIVLSKRIYRYMTRKARAIYKVFYFMNKKPIENNKPNKIMERDY